jgi:electron transport complex protein RnfB
MKSVDVYERLADALDALPAGFTRTPSKLEIKLIKLVFTHEEALVAGTLSRKLETAAEIAQRVGRGVTGMARRSEVSAARRKS